MGARHPAARAPGHGHTASDSPVSLALQSLMVLSPPSCLVCTVQFLRFLEVWPAPQNIYGLSFSIFPDLFPLHPLQWQDHLVFVL